MGPCSSVSPWLWVPMALCPCVSVSLCPRGSGSLWLGLLRLGDSPSFSDSRWLHLCWGFYWISPITNDIEPLFTCLLSIFILWWRVCSYVLPALKKELFVFWCLILTFPYVFWVQVFSHLCGLEIYSPSCELSFFFLSLFWTTEYFNFNNV